MNSRIVAACIVASFFIPHTVGLSAETNQALRTRRFQEATPPAAVRWQKQSRETLFKLMTGGKKPMAPKLDPKILQRIEMPAGGYVPEELSLQTLPERVSVTVRRAS